MSAPNTYIELTDNDVQAKQPEQCCIPLKPHQLTLLHKCIEIESIPIIKNQQTIATSVGIIGDSVGAGKSYVILSLCCKQFRPDLEKKSYISYGKLMTIICDHKSTETIRDVPVSLIVIPHNLCNQWSKYVETFNPEWKYLMIKTYRGVHQTINFTDYDVIFITNSQYNDFAKLETVRQSRFSKLFFDEPDNINIPGCLQIQANFYWFVTATVDNLRLPTGRYIYNAQIDRYVELTKGLKNSGFIKEVFQSMPSWVTDIIIVKNTDEFVNNSINLPPMTSKIIKCKCSHAINILNNLVDRNVMIALNGNDIKRAIMCLDPGRRCTEDNIVGIFVEKLKVQLHNLALKREYKSQLVYHSDAERNEELNKLDAEKNSIVSKMAMIEERVRSVNMCQICYDVIHQDEKSILDCCVNSFCFRCVSKWLSMNSRCPCCRAEKRINDIIVSTIPENADPITLVAPTIISEPLKTKFENLEELLIPNANKKYMLLSQYDVPFMSILPHLQEKNMKYSLLKGNGNVVNNIIKIYKEGDLDVLLVNPNHYGCGMNLENTTDIIMFHKFDTQMEKQIIGRANRYGRTTSLNVWYLLHENEMDATS